MQHLNLGVQFIKPCLENGQTMCSHSLCLTKIAVSHGTKKCCSVRFLCPKEEFDKSPRNGLGFHLKMGIKRRNRRLRWITGIGF
jgi:hypothetical protein